MADKRTIYRLSWSPSRGTALAYVVTILAIMYLPCWLQFPVHVNAWIGVVAELLLAAAGTLFFYEGLKRSEQLKVYLLVLSQVFLFGSIANLFHQATFYLEPTMILTDIWILGLLNGAALLCTLTIYRLNKEEAGPASPVPALPFYTKIPPAGVSALIFLITVVLMVNSQHLPPYNKIWSANLPFFICVLLFLTVGSGFYFFKTSSFSHRLRMGLTMLALSTLFGTIGNTTHHSTEFHVGYRIVMNATEFIFMNAGAILTVTMYFVWKRFLESVNAKASAAEQPKKAPESAPSSESTTTSATAGGTNPSATASDTSTSTASDTGTSATAGGTSTVATTSDTTRSS